MLKLAQGYRWKGITSDGQRLSGHQIASGVEAVRAQLQRRGIIASKIQTQKILLLTYENLKPRDIANLSRQLASLLTARVPLMTALDLLIRTATHKKALAVLLNSLKTELENGNTMSSALGKHQRYFNTLYCGLISLGEQSGHLDLMLTRLAEHQEKILQVKAKIHKALLYPSVVLSLSFSVFLVLLLLVVPQFEQLFATARVPLPHLTQQVITLANFLQQYGITLVALLGSLWMIGLLLKQKWPRFDRQWHQFLLAIPILGPAFKNALLAHVVQTLATSLSAGITLVEALTMLAETVTSPGYKTAIFTLRAAIINGVAFDKALQQQSVFPPLMQQMVMVGQASGTLNLMLDKLADLLTAQVDQRLAQVSELLEPLLMALLGVMVGGLIIALYLPIFKLGSVV